MRRFVQDCKSSIIISEPVPEMSASVDSERGYIRVSRMNEIYREELIELRRRVSSLSSNVLVPLYLTNY